MDKPAIIKQCKELGCCNACCIRYLGFKSPLAYKNPHEYILKILEENKDTKIDGKESENEDDLSKNDLKENTNKVEENKNTTEHKVDESDTSNSTHIVKNDSDNDNSTEIKTEVVKNESDNDNSTEIKNESDNDNSTEIKTEVVDRNGKSSPPAKRRKSDICVSCLGVLQEKTWTECLDTVKEQLEKKKYDCDTFACALSAPIATLLREKVITLHIEKICESYDPNILTALKEAWKWSFGIKLESHLNKTLVSGTSAPLLVTVTIEYPDDLEELEILKKIAPKLFESRRQQKRRFAIEFTRRSVEQALEELDLEALQKLDSDLISIPRAAVKCVSVMSEHVPQYLAGRYIKLSRELPQTPWLVNGKRMMETSVQEIIFEPIAKLYGMSKEDADARLKFMSAGREDVDVRCLADGRPFAIEVTDPATLLTREQLAQVCKKIAKDGRVKVEHMVYINRDDLTLLKKGEETKTKCYEALCVKLSHSKNDDKSAPIQVTDKDIENINTYSNTDEKGTRVVIQQKTPIRVLHRRPLLTRTRRIHEMTAEKVPDHPNLFIVRVITEAGTYVKEWAHGELGRSRPALGQALAARVDILALDVVAVNLPWPPKLEAS